MFSILVIPLIYRVSSLFLHFTQRLSCVKPLQQQKQQNRAHHTKSDVCIRSSAVVFAWLTARLASVEGDAFGRKYSIHFKK